MDQILIVEDDKNFLKLVQYNLEKAGFACPSATSGEEALELLKSKSPALVILDIMLPKIDGLEVCRHIRQKPQTKDLPIIMLTAKAEEVDRVVGFEIGADDYIAKPFSPRELVLRVKAILRRKQAGQKPSADETLSDGLVTVNESRHEVTVKNRRIDLPPMEFKLLATLIKRRGRVQTREVFLADVWEIHSDVDTRTVDTHIKRLREKLGAHGDLIETVVGVGYRWKDSPKP